MATYLGGKYYLINGAWKSNKGTHGCRFYFFCESPPKHLGEKADRLDMAKRQTWGATGPCDWWFYVLCKWSVSGADQIWIQSHRTTFSIWDHVSRNLNTLSCDFLSELLVTFTRLLVSVKSFILYNLFLLCRTQNVRKRLQGLQDTPEV